MDSKPEPLTALDTLDARVCISVGMDPRSAVKRALDFDGDKMKRQRTRKGGGSNQLAQLKKRFHAIVRKVDEAGPANLAGNDQIWLALYYLSPLDADLLKKKRAGADELVEIAENIAGVEAAVASVWRDKN